MAEGVDYLGQTSAAYLYDFKIVYKYI